VKSRDWDAGLPIFLLAYKVSMHDTVGLTPAGLVFRRELQLPCDLLFWAYTVNELPMTDHVLNLVGHLHNIRNYVRFEVSMVVTVKSANIWDVMACGSCKNRQFGRMYRIHHQGDKNRLARNNISSN
jgi:hypothetical protein